jgi:hypothetical protein
MNPGVGKLLHGHLGALPCAVLTLKIFVSIRDSNDMLNFFISNEFAASSIKA